MPYVLDFIFKAIYPSEKELESYKNQSNSCSSSYSCSSYTDEEWDRMKVVAHMHYGKKWRDHVGSCNSDSFLLYGCNDDYINSYKHRHML